MTENLNPVFYFMAGERGDDRIYLEILALLEEKPLQTKDLGKLLVRNNYSERNVNRKLETLRELGFPLESEHRHHILTRNTSYAEQLLTLLSTLTVSLPEIRVLTFGTIDPKVAAPSLYHLEKPATTLRTVLASIENPSPFFFWYLPQTEETLGRVRLLGKIFGDAPRDSFPVEFLPSHLVFSADQILLLGRNLSGKYRGKVRQYSLRGIDSIETRTRPADVPVEFFEKINPREIYQHSMRVWIGGTVRELEIEEIQPGGKSQRKKQNVNGEDEILSYLASSLGHRKLVNPPAEIVTRARELGLSPELLFRFESENLPLGFDE